MFVAVGLLVAGWFLVGNAAGPALGAPGTPRDALPPPSPAVDIPDSSLVSIGRAREDANGDGLPDRDGQSLAVAGRVSVAPGVLGDSARIFLQDDTHGIAVKLPANPAHILDIRRGDSLHVHGTVGHIYGLTRIVSDSVEIVDAPSRPPEPRTITLADAQGETYEGQLVHLTGSVVNIGVNEGGRYLLIGDSSTDAVVAVWVSNTRLGTVNLQYESGDELEVTGLLAQHDFTRPYGDFYEIIPRSNADVQPAGHSLQYYRNVIIAISLVVVLAVGGVFVLRAEVKRRTRQLAESRTRYRLLAEATFEGIVIHENGEIVDVNQSLTELVGYNRDELIGENALNFLTDASKTIVAQNIEAGSEVPYEGVIVRKDGSTFPAEIEARNLDVSDNPMRVAAIRDITQRKQDEAELRLAKEEAEKVARLKSSLLNNMSHELRTPITSIIGYAELIMEEPPDMHAEFAARIRQSGRRLSETLRSVLEMAQIEAGTLDLRLHSVDVERIAYEVTDLHRADAAAQQIDIEVTCTGDCTLHTDRMLIYRVMSNLIHNAIKFTPHGTVRVDVSEADLGLTLTVSDTGIGIAEEFQPHLFEPFKQESQGRSRSYEGTGLGLAITKRMVDLLGGTIEVHSVKDEGSTFTIDLPPSLPQSRDPESVLLPSMDGE